MASGLANGVLGKLGEIAARAAWNEASLLLNFKNDFKWLEKKLRQICASLQAADEQSEQNKNVKEWLIEVRNIAFDAEDIIDECAVEHLYTNTSQSCVYNCSSLVFRYKMAKRIKELKGRIRATIQEAQDLKLFYDVSHLSLPSTSTSGSERTEELSFLEKDLPAVAVDYKVEEILRLLDNPAFRVVAVVGMGGLGKTFLLQHVFSITKHRYDCSAWISVSQTYSLRKLQCDLASHIDLELASQVSGLGITDVRAAALIHDKLEGKRCLIVLDDIWSRVEGDLISRLGLPTGSSNQCKIVVTTRSRGVAENIDAHIYEMQHLWEGESWDLFCLFAFRNREGNRPPEQLESLAHQIVEECGRLPLAIKTVAASMAKSSLPQEWESKLGQLKKVRNAEDPILNILKLSYDCLPPYLKSCFAYFSFFPEDTQISLSTFKIPSAIYQDYVIYLWIAEGFIPQEKDREQWDIGLDYLHQLENLCLLEVNRVLSCYTVHDLFLDLVVNICKEDECEFDIPVNETRFRRLLLANKGVYTNVISERPLLCKRFLRTLSFSQNPGITSVPEQLLDHVKVLRVIDLSLTAISTLPKCVGKLKLLKVLNLSRTEIKEVPDCVRRLKSLQFLDLSFCTSLQRIPDWIGELKCLSYCNVIRFIKLIEKRMPKGISQLSSLRTLRSDLIPLSTEGNGFFNIKDVCNLIDLLEIRFTLKDARTLKSVEDGILDSLVKMRFLGIENAISTTEGDREESSLPAFPEKMKVMKGLQKLRIVRFSVPSWICGMENLTELFLTECSDYPSLQKMPNLQLLILANDSKCRYLPKNFGERGGFPKLANLQIEDFPLLEELPALEEGAMPRLEFLLIDNCPLVKRVPEGLERLRRLKVIRVVKGEASGELEERLKEGGEDWNKIKANNPRIQIFFE
ncbi:hypothetical protein SUGI_0357850 [Cryptomeria japonica]|uniref:putative disease resistance protein At3g14460 n=1 Tax=Cryptomeria japonica TaxID=3369 RepID=UPI002408EA4B|nr:putative disease resistance protein At3g14460 [Cryptomeria japonica]GLJ19752.1 hypothetical protein SUGI_0357850 [Cryptomeria japonica]